MTAVNASDSQLLPEGVFGPHRSDQTRLNLASEGVQRYRWQCAFGAMMIEVKDGAACVNGQRVKPPLPCAFVDSDASSCLSMHEFRLRQVVVGVRAPRKAPRH